MVRVAVFPDQEPENRSGTPECRLVVSQIRLLGANPGICWSQPTSSPRPTLLLLPVQVMLTLWPGDPDTEGG